jgi:CBS-domain-containing membrane protein
MFQGTLEQMRQVRQVFPAERSRALKPLLRDGHNGAVSEAVEYGAPVGGTLQRSAIAAYTTTNEPVHLAWHALAVSEVMHSPAMTLTVDTSVDQAWQQLVFHGRGQAPVVNARGILVGMVTRAVLANYEQWPEPGASAQAWDSWRAQSIEAVMLTPIPSVAPGTELRRATSALIDSALPGLPVVDEEGRVVGLVSRTDVLRAALKDAGLDAWG